MKRVLVTGASGFLGAHLVAALAARGHGVRGTVRSPEKAESLRAALSRHAGQEIEVELVAADLSADAGWAAALDGIDVVHHVASPFPSGLAKSADAVIAPARDGTRRVLAAAEQAGATRVVMTSSIAAVDAGWGRNAPDLFDETHWSRFEASTPDTYYAESKTLAEQAAWEFVRDRALELVVINPVGILGPLITTDLSPSMHKVVAPLGGRRQAYPRLHDGVVDVRDVAAAHLAAMETPAAAGERFIVCAESIWLSEIGAILADSFPGRPIRSWEIPAWLTPLAALADPGLRSQLGNIGRPRRYDTTRAETRLGLRFRPVRETLVDAAKSAIALGLAES